ncbi:MAG: polyprenyl synthetase family protein [Gammaproteobacteria bacterium]|nr:polyprenyl synthetase family protein [Gammaproteobacteria bacterium]
MPASPVAEPLATLDAAIACTATGPDAAFGLVRGDFEAVNRLIPQQLSSPVPLIEEIGRHIVSAGGKRLRPLIALLASRLCGHEGMDGPVRLAVVIEFLHTATLLHDDVVDHSPLRRGQATANTLWGNGPSVLVGDFLYSRAFELMVELDSMPVMAIISEATNRVAEGEVMQLANIGNADIDEREYMAIIRRKTAMLFQASAHTGAALAGADAATTAALKNYGLHFGLAYQLVDDWLDYAGERDVMGKDAGNDLAEGKMTLPLIHAARNGTSTDAALIRQAIESRSTERLPQVLAAVRRTGALDYTRDRAQVEIQRALAETSVLHPNRHREGLRSLAQFAASRLA